MTLKEKLPVSYLLFTLRGRISRLTYWTVSIFIWTSFYILFSALHYFISYSATCVIYPLLFWALIATATKRLHDNGITGYWICIVLLPVVGPLALFYFLGMRRGDSLPNRFGPVPGSKPDYFKNKDAEIIPHLKSDERIVNDVTQLNPVLVSKVETPTTVEELQKHPEKYERAFFHRGWKVQHGRANGKPAKYPH